MKKIYFVFTLLFTVGLNSNYAQNTGWTSDTLVTTDLSWVYSNNEYPGWQKLDFDDSNWNPVLNLGDSCVSYCFIGGDHYGNVHKLPYACFLRKKFNVGNKAKTFMNNSEDDDAEIYINGNLVFVDNNHLAGGYDSLDVTQFIIPNDTNIIAVKHTDWYCCGYGMSLLIYSPACQGLTVYADQDGDGYGDLNKPLFVADCMIPAGYVPDSTDCDDANVSVHPGAQELLNGIDDNCNGQIDEAGWTKKADFGGVAREGAIGFSIESKGYTGLGAQYPISYKDFWEYDPTINAWTQKADFGGSARLYAVGFAINGKGYVGTGQSGTYPNYTYYKDFWEYDPISNNWTQKSEFGGTSRYGAVGFSIDGKGYLGTGSDAMSGYEKDFWEFDPVQNTWIQKKDFGGAGRKWATGFSIGEKGYLGTGLDADSLFNDFWEYDPSINLWAQESDFGGAARIVAVGFSIGNKGYIGTGQPFSKDFWEFDPANNTWKQKADFEGTARGEATGFSIGNNGYIGTGVDPSYQRDFWEYSSPTINSQDSLALVALYNSTDGTNWTDHKNWLTNSPLSTWYGVTITGTRVSKIALANNQLNDSIPSSIGNLDSLHTLDVNHNQLNDSIPVELHKLKHLYYLDLSNNQLSGYIPPSLTKMKRLEYLYLDSNQLAGRIPPSFGELVNLIEFNARLNDLRDSIPSGLGDLMKLQYLNLSHNKLTGTIPTTFGNLTAIRRLVLSHNRLTGNIPSSFNNLTMQNTLAVGFNDLSGSVPGLLTALPQLRVLRLIHNRYTFDGMEALVQHPFDTLRYWLQKKIAVHQNGNTLSVYAGGTLSNNTYNWYRNGALAATISGDSIFTPTSSGDYNVEVTNYVAIKLTLRSDTVSFNGLRGNQQNDQNNIVAKAIDKNGYSIYPNPVKDVLHLNNLSGNATISIITQDGRLVDKKTVAGSSYAWNVKDLSAGSYYVRIEADKAVTIMKFIKQ
jgi:hypothetical protein